MDDIEKRSVGNFIVCRMVMRAVGMFMGGFLTNRVSIEEVYAIYCIFPLGVLVWTLMFFQEMKVSSP